MEASPHHVPPALFSPGCPVAGFKQDDCCPLRTLAESTGTQLARTPSLKAYRNAGVHVSRRQVAVAWRRARNVFSRKGQEVQA
jgi:hypothetical protein